MNETAPLPVSRFSTSDLPDAGQFAAWRQGNAVMFDVRPTDGIEPPVFPAEAVAYHLGQLIIGETQFPPQRYVRGPATAGQDGLQLFLVRLLLEGRHDGRYGNRMVSAAAGDLDVIDMAQPLDCTSSAARLIVAGIPRPLMLAVLPSAEALHGTVLGGDQALGGLLADYLRMLLARLPQLTQDEADGVASAALGMITACLRPSLEPGAARPGGRAGETILAEVKRRIEANLRSPELSVESLCADMGLSRASLYRLLQPLGGVRGYIRDRRLVNAFRALADPSQSHRPIGEIAFEWGFASDAHFGRLFRRAFGCSPREARDLPRISRAARRGMASEGVGEPGYAAWLRRLAERDH